MWFVLDHSLCSICLSSTSGLVIWHASHCTDHEPCLGDSPYIHLSSTWSWAFLPLSLGICRLVCDSFLIDDHCATFVSLKHWSMDHDSGIQSYWWLITLSSLLYLDWCWALASFTSQFSDSNTCFWSAHIQNVNNFSIVWSLH